ncbi:arylsulfotransferase family protein [Halomonas huangheensis]|nr:arylsulfotransferase family protein [Halomonas huangheensis]
MARKPIGERLGPVMFVASLGVIAVIYGAVASERNWFPAPQISLAQRTMMDISHNWKNDLALEPTRHLVKPVGDNPGTDRGLEGKPSGASSEGYVLVAGLNEDQDESFHVVRLYDREGNEVHRWPVHYDWLEDEHKPQNVMLHGMEVFEDGSLAVTFDAGNVIARIDACGKPMWTRKGSFHHSINRDGDGQLVTLLGEGIAWLDEDTGEITHKLDIVKDLAEYSGGDQRATFDIRTRTPDNLDQEVRYLMDPFHPNDAEPLRAEMADAFPMFDAGDVLLSLRELNLLAVVDPQTGQMKWHRHGPWFKQHDPDFEPDGTISVFDNATGTGATRILSIRPGEEDVETLFSGSEDQPFYSWRRGKHQVLEDGSILLTEAEGGRVLDVSGDGEVLWQRHMKWDAENNLIITEARFVPDDFFDKELPRCSSS